MEGLVHKRVVQVLEPLWSPLFPSESPQGRQLLLSQLVQTHKDYGFLPPAPSSTVALSLFIALFRPYPWTVSIHAMRTILQPGTLALVVTAAQYKRQIQREE